MATEKQIEANRRNAQASTGPRTPDGKARTRWNSYRHGLAGSGALLAPDELYELQTRMDIWREKFGGRATDPILLKQLAIESIKLERAQAITQAYLGDLVDQSQRAWAAKRREEIDRFAADLGSNPSRIGPKLCTTAYGCEWLMMQWVGLLQSIEANGVWTPKQCTIALDLLGVPLDFREGKTPIDPPNPEVSERDHRLSMAREEIDRFKAAMHGLMEYEEEERSRFGLGLIWETDETLERLGRYEAQTRKMFKWAYAKLEKDVEARERRAREKRSTLSDTLAEVPWSRELEDAYRDRQLSGLTEDAESETDGPALFDAASLASARSIGQLGAMRMGYEGDPELETRIEAGMREVKRRQEPTARPDVAPSLSADQARFENRVNEPNFEHKSNPKRTESELLAMSRHLST